MTGVLIKRRKLGHTTTQKGEGHVKMEADTGVY